MHASFQRFLKALAYFANAVRYTSMMFMELSPGVQFLKLFSPILMVRQNKPECLTLASLFEDSLIFASKARSRPIEWNIVRCFIKVFRLLC